MMADEVVHPMVALRIAVNLAVAAKSARRVYYSPAPSADNIKRMKWVCRPAAVEPPSMFTLYCHITEDGDVLHSFQHILHPFVGKIGHAICQACRLLRTDRIHTGVPKDTLMEFFTFNHGELQELPVDMLYGEARKPFRYAVE